MKPKIAETEISIVEISRTTLSFCIVGTSPLVLHAMSLKAQQMLLFPAPPKNRADRATSMKHEPFEEFRDACYMFADHDDKPTRLYMPAGAFHSSIANAALDMVGAKKAQVARLTNVPGQKIPVWGIPEIITMIVRSADIARTPDIHTLPILPEWAARFDVRFVSLIKQQSVANLVGAAGEIVGIGDGRPERGKLSYGQFRVCSEDDSDFERICEQGGRAAQDRAMADPRPHDLETEKLLRWFTAERERRVASPPPPAKRVPRRNGDTAIQAGA